VSYDTYFRRLNSTGTSYQKRLQHKREKLFDKQLAKSIYRVMFDFDEREVVGELTPYRQNETKILKYLLTKRDVKLPNGTIIEPKRVDGCNEVISEDDDTSLWMVFWKEDVNAKGYNKYVMLRMSHFLTWVDRSGVERSSYAYFYGQENNMLKDELKSRSRTHTLYTENLKLSFYILPRNPYLKKDDYFEIGEGEYKEAYVVTGYDLQSTPGVAFVSVDPQPVRDLTPPPKKEDPQESEDDYFWVGGGD
jgi:hypothetical protein